MTQPSHSLLSTAQSLAVSPIGRWLNYSATADDEGLLHHLGFSEAHIGNPAIRALHGGVVATFLEFAAQAELAAHFGEPRRFFTVTNSTDYMASTRATDMTARVAIGRIARRIAFLEATGWQTDADRPVATARICLRLTDGDA